MHRPFWIILAATAAFAGPVHAQTIKAKGAAAAGVCAGALELAAGMTSKSPTGRPAAIVNMQNARDFFAAMPQFNSAEITANAEAFIRLMSQRGQATTTEAERTALSKEIFGIAKKCFDSIQQYAVAPPSQGQAQPLQPGVTTTQPAIVQTTPQPLTVQPLETQPLIINPQ